MTSTTIASSAMLLAGIGIPMMAALNAGLGERLGNPVQAAVILFAVGLVCCLIVLAVIADPVTWELERIKPQYFLGGFLVAFYVLGITFAAPRIGVGQAVVIVLLGQVICSAIVDHFGFFGAPQMPLNWVRATGLALLGAGIALVRLGGI